MTMRRQRREDPAYLTAMREAKELFDAEMAKNSMKGRGRPKTVIVAAPAAVTEIEIEHEVADEVVDLSSDEAEDEDVEEVEEVAPQKPARPMTKSAARPTKTAARSSVKSAPKAPARAVKKPAAKKKAAPMKKAAKRR